MDMLECHKQACESSSTVAYHDFLLEYKKDKNSIYIFVEGKPDCNYYKPNIEIKIKEKLDVICIIAKNKNNVIGAYGCFNWSEHSREQIVFFIDRDYSEYLDEQLLYEKNVYITDGYSIENSIVSKRLCERYLHDCKDMTDLTASEICSILDIFDEEIKKFYEYYLEIASYLIAWRKSNLKVFYDCLNLAEIFIFDEGRLKLNSNNIFSVLGEFCQKVNIKNIKKGDPCLSIDAFKNVANKVKEKLINIDPKKYVRGKHELWFAVQFCDSIQQHSNEISENTDDRPKYSEATIIKIFNFFANKIEMPESLDIFLEDTVCEYVQTFEVLSRA
jgi:hypothetical protein